MNIESNYIDSTDGNNLNELCKDYSILKTKYEEAKAEYDACVKGIKKLCTEKVNETSKYIVKMKITPESFILDSKKVQNEYPEIFEECQKVRAGSTSIQEVLKK